MDCNSTSCTIWCHLDAHKTVAPFHNINLSIRLGNWVSTSQQLTAGLSRGFPLSHVATMSTQQDRRISNRNNSTQGLTLEDDGFTCKTASSNNLTAVAAVMEELNSVSRRCQEAGFETNLSTAQALWCTLRDKSVGQCHVSGQWTYQWSPSTEKSWNYSTDCPCPLNKTSVQKGLSTLKTMVAQGIEQRPLFLFHQNVIHRTELRDRARA